MIITPATDAEIIMKVSENVLWIGDVVCSLFPFGVVGYVPILEETLWISWTVLDVNAGDDGPKIDWSRTVDCEKTNDWRTKLGDKDVIDNILEFNVIVSNVFIVAWEPITDKLFEDNLKRMLYM
jgi:hypothetical protein